ncbi:MAG: hypothetical protein LBV23_08500 [Deltaproteobacteria bacterium]|nr:hypothetical protein [Deltaproteobacteria bacterium]
MRLKFEIGLKGTSAAAGPHFPNSIIFFKPDKSADYLLKSKKTHKF